MEKMTYVQLGTMITYYLEMYPHVGVALEATLEDVEGDGKLAKEVRSAMERINNGESDVLVLGEWADATGSRDLELLSTRIEAARAKGEDIGLYLRKFSPKPQHSKDQNRQSYNKKRKGFKSRRDYNGNQR